MRLMPLFIVITAALPAARLLHRPDVLKRDFVKRRASRSIYDCLFARQTQMTMMSDN